MYSKKQFYVINFYLKKIKYKKNFKHNLIIQIYCRNHEVDLYIIAAYKCTCSIKNNVKILFQINCLKSNILHVNKSLYKYSINHSFFYFQIVFQTRKYIILKEALIFVIPVNLIYWNNTKEKRSRF